MNISSGAIGRVLVDQNMAFHFLADSRVKRNRQIRLIKNIDYPMDYFMVHVKRTSDPGAAETSEKKMHNMSMTDNGNDTDEDSRTKVASCGPVLKALSQDIVGATKKSAVEQVTPAPVQVDHHDVLFILELITGTSYGQVPFSDAMRETLRILFPLGKIMTVTWLMSTRAFWLKFRLTF